MCVHLHYMLYNIFLTQIVLGKDRLRYQMAELLERYSVFIQCFTCDYPL